MVQARVWTTTHNLPITPPASALTLTAYSPHSSESNPIKTSVREVNTLQRHLISLGACQLFLTWLKPPSGPLLFLPHTLLHTSLLAGPRTAPRLPPQGFCTSFLYPGHSFPKYIQALPPSPLLGLSSKATLWTPCLKLQPLQSIFLFIICLPFLECKLHDSEGFWLFCFLFFPAYSRHTINICLMNEWMNLSSILFSGGWGGKHGWQQEKNVEILWQSFTLTWHSVPSVYVGTRNTRNAGGTCSILWWICLQRL